MNMSTERGTSEVFGREFVELKRAVQCPVCIGILNDPVALDCSHTFCRECINSSLKFRADCPICSSNINRRKITTLTHLQPVIAAFKLLIDSLEPDTHRPLPRSMLLNPEIRNRNRNPQPPAACAEITDTLLLRASSVQSTIEDSEGDCVVFPFENVSHQTSEVLPTTREATVSTVVSAPEASAPSVLKPGVLVTVLPRTWIGINRLGGRGWVLACHENTEGVFYDVKYVLEGTTDKFVPAVFVEPHDEIEEPRSKRRSSRSRASESERCCPPLMIFNKGSKAGSRVDTSPVTAAADLSIGKDSTPLGNSRNSGSTSRRKKDKRVDYAGANGKTVDDVISDNCPVNLAANNNVPPPVTLCYGKLSSSSSVLSASVHVPASKSRSRSLETRTDPTTEPVAKRKRHIDDSKSIGLILPTAGDCCAGVAAAGDDNDGANKKRLVILTTSVSSHIVEESQQLAAAYQDTVLIANRFGPTVTHLVVTTDKKGVLKARTMKYMQALNYGLWIVSSAWVVDSLKAGKLLNEEPYEVHTNAKAHVINAPRRSRLAHQNPSGHRLLSGVYALLFGQFPTPGPPRSDLEELLNTSGACVSTDFDHFRQVANKFQSGEKHKHKQVHLVVICAEAVYGAEFEEQWNSVICKESTAAAAVVVHCNSQKKSRFSLRDNLLHQVHVLEPLWLLDSITNFDVQNFAPYSRKKLYT